MKELRSKTKKCNGKNGRKSSSEVKLHCQNCLVESSSQVVKDFSEHKTSDSKLICPWCLSYQLRKVAGDSR